MATTTPNERPKQVRMSPEQRAAQLVEVAYATLKREGIDAVTRETVAHRAGVTPQLTSRYFKEGSNGMRAAAVGEAIKLADVKTLKKVVKAGTYDIGQFKMPRALKQAIHA